MKILIACEESQAVCKEMRRLGHEAYSADIQDCSGGHPEWHIKGDVLPLINGRCSFKTCDGAYHEIPVRWDMLIAHPPCTYLSSVAGIHFSLKHTPAEKVVKRWENRAKAAVFFMQFALADCEKIAVENPIGFMSSSYRKADQTIHPYMFAESENSLDYVTKSTCLWLKGLPKLVGNNMPRPDNAKIFGRLPNGKARCWEDSNHGGKNRSKTFPGIARAMAEQWAGRCEE